MSLIEMITVSITIIGGIFAYHRYLMSLLD